MPLQWSNLPLDIILIIFSEIIREEDHVSNLKVLSMVDRRTRRAALPHIFRDILIQSTHIYPSSQHSTLSGAIEERLEGMIAHPRLRHCMRTFTFRFSRLPPAELRNTLPVLQRIFSELLVSLLESSVSLRAVEFALTEILIPEFVQGISGMKPLNGVRTVILQSDKLAPVLKMLPDVHTLYLIAPGVSKGALAGTTHLQTLCVPDKMSAELCHVLVRDVPTLQRLHLRGIDRWSRTIMPIREYIPLLSKLRCLRCLGLGPADLLNFGLFPASLQPMFSNPEALDLTDDKRHSGIIDYFQSGLPNLQQVAFEEALYEKTSTNKFKRSQYNADSTFWVDFM